MIRTASCNASVEGNTPLIANVPGKTIKLRHLVVTVAEGPFEADVQQNNGEQVSPTLYAGFNAPMYGFQLTKGQGLNVYVAQGSSARATAFVVYELV